MSTDAISRAAALVEVGRPEQAAALLREALATSPHDPRLLDQLATAELQFDTSAALDTARRLIAVEPDGFRGHYLAASASYELGKVKKSIEHAELAVEAAPWSPSTHALYAEAVSRRSRGRRRASRAADRAIELAPQSPIGYVAAGNVDLHHGLAYSAAKWYEKALELDPHNRTAQLNLALAREAHGSLAPAFKNAQGLLALDPRDAGARQVLDQTVYTTVVHLMWVTAVALFILGVLRGI
jgi:tetratricopeptide (TPR) repeat protein